MCSCFVPHIVKQTSMPHNIVGVAGGEREYITPYKRKKRNKQEKKAKLTKFDQFCQNFAAEIDIFDSDLGVPAWVFDYRDDQIRKISPELRKICQRLKDLGLAFKVKWPVEIDGKWKFADVFFPRQRTVLMVTNAMAVAGRPHWMLSDRAEFFKDRFRVVEVETLEDLERKMELKAQTK